MGQIGNSDETPIWFDMPRNYTITEKRTKEVFIKTSGCEKRRVTVMLAITADGRKLHPFLIFKRKTNPKTIKSEKLFPDDVIVCNQEKRWMTETLMFDWLRNEWEIRPCGLSKIPSMLCLDAFRGHLTDAVREKIHSLASDHVVIPIGMTSVLQPLDVSINKPFKGYIQEQYEKWFCEPNRELTPTGKIKRAAPHIVAN
jgi:DDE superfamily endonuclease.